MTCPRCGGIAIVTFHDDIRPFDRCLQCGWQSNFATQRAEREEVSEWIYDEEDDDA